MAKSGFIPRTFETPPLAVRLLSVCLIALLLVPILLPMWPRGEAHHHACPHHAGEASHEAHHTAPLTEIRSVLQAGAHEPLAPEQAARTCDHHAKGAGVQVCGCVHHNQQPLSPLPVLDKFVVALTLSVEIQPPHEHQFGTLRSAPSTPHPDGVFHPPRHLT